MWHVKLKKLICYQLVDSKQPIRLKFYHYGIYGGHNIAGSALCDNGVLIDFSNMTTVIVDSQKRRAYVEPGATLGDIDKAVQAHGLATPVGINSTTGIAGLTLGGGFGWLTRKYGMTIDNLVSAEMVTADGRKIQVSEDENNDLAELPQFLKTIRVSEILIFKTAFSEHLMFQGHTHQNFVRTHHKSSRIYQVYAFSVSLTVRDIPDIVGQFYYFYYRDWFS